MAPLAGQRARRAHLFRIACVVCATTTACGAARSRPATPAASRAESPAAVPTPATTPPPAVSAAPSAERGPLDARIDPIFSAYAHGLVPGCAVGVYRAGEVAFAKGYGYADLEHPDPISPATPFVLASLAKQFTAASILLLAADGRVTLTDSVRKYLPDLPPWAQGITLDHLLHHTSGVRDYGVLVDLTGRGGPDRVTADDVAWILWHQRGVNFAPGADFSYANSGYFLLGAVVKAVAGESLGAFAKERIFDPLGMRDTRLKEDAARLIPGRAESYHRSSDGFRSDAANTESVGAGNLVSTVADLARWDANFYDEKVGGPALVDGLRARGSLADGTQLTYARGLAMGVTNGVASEEHTGAAWGYRATLVRYPSERVTVAVLCNDGAAQPADLARRVATVFVPALAEAPPLAAGAPADAAPWPAGAPGTYFDPKTGGVRVVVAKDAAFTMSDDASGRWGTRLAPRAGAPGMLSAGGDDYAFVPAPDRAAARLLRRSKYGGHPTEFVRIEPIARPPSAQLAEYAGRYSSEESPRDIAVVLKNEKLFVGAWGGPLGAGALAPLLRDVFASSGVAWTFERDGRGKVKAVVMTTERTRGVRFEKR